jgi:D-serine deaminase-like pyridoxal phosphate-dependent protein
MNVADIDTPALIVDLDVMEQNIAAMSAFFRGREAKLRPHFKSPKASAIAQRLLAAGAIGLTCAKVGEAEVLVEHGINDVLIANQVIGAQKIERLMRLARRADVMVAVDDDVNVAALSAAAKTAQAALGVLIEVDVGMHRCGVRSIDAAIALARTITQAPGLRFAGVMGYEGHAVMEVERAARVTKAMAAMDVLTATTSALAGAGFPCAIVSAGGTGTYDITGIRPGITEIQAGSYVLMDGRYAQLDLPFRCALTLATTVISVPDRRAAIIDAGMKSISFEFGLPTPIDLPDAALVFLSEEHGHLHCRGPQPQCGQRLRLLPSHSDTTVNLHDRLYACRGNQVEEIIAIEARGRFT